MPPVAPARSASSSDNKDGLLRPGTYADVVFNVGTSPKSWLCQRESLLRSESPGRYVIMAMGEGRFEPRDVETGLVTEGR